MQHVIQINQKNGWKGQITVEIPSHPQRLQVIASVSGHKLIQSKDCKTKEDKEKAFENNTPILAAAYEHAKKLVRGIKLEGPGGEKCEDLETLETHEELDQVWVEIAAKYLGGYGPGKKKSQS